MVSYFPYVALGLVALLGYFYINNLTNIVRDLEAKNSTLQAEVVNLNNTLDNVRRSHVEMTNALRRYSSSVNSMKSSVDALSVKLAKQENRLDRLAKEHPEMVAKIVNDAVAKRMQCLVSASRGERNAVVNGQYVDCD